jgi:hypothetical protein
VVERDGFRVGEGGGWEKRMCSWMGKSVKVRKGLASRKYKEVHTSRSRGPPITRFSRPGNATVQAHEFRGALREVLLRRQNASLDLARTSDVADTSTPPSSSSSSGAP